MSRRLDAAARIGRAVAAEAIAYEGRCTWVGSRLERDPQGRWIRAHPVAGPVLYDGTAGIGLALAELSAATGDRAARAAGGAALRHALSHRHRCPTDGLYDGKLGIALAALQGGRALDDAEIEFGGRALLDELVGGPCDARHANGADVMSGLAGVVLGLLALRDADPRCRDRATAVARQLADRVRAAGVVRASGLAHGWSGVALALAEAAAAADAPDLLDASSASLDAERALFDQASGNWRDVRDDEPAGGEVGGSGVAWCHGAAGIALSRLRTVALNVSGLGREELDVALKTTRDWVHAAAADPRRGFTLCHGVAGAADTLITCAGELGRDDLRATAIAAAEAGIDEHDRSDPVVWPCGAAGASPALMTGHAGVVLFLLRTEFPSLGSPLLPLSEPVATLSGRSRESSKERTPC